MPLTSAPASDKAATMPRTVVGATSSSPEEIRRVFFASIVGTIIEWYDFLLYGIAAALIFNKLFFPAQDPLSGTLTAFATYTVGFKGSALVPSLPAPPS